MTYCLLCLHPIRRHWWHAVIPPLRVHSGPEAAACARRLDRMARAARTPI